MKSKLLTNVYATIAALFALPTEMQAQGEYGLWINGVQVTHTNCDDLSFITGVSGTVHFHPKSKTLTLSNTTIDAPDNEYCIKSTIDGLTIEVRGTNNLNSGITSL